MQHREAWVRRRCYLSAQVMHQPDRWWHRGWNVIARYESIFISQKALKCDSMVKLCQPVKKNHLKTHSVVSKLPWNQSCNHSWRLKSAPHVFPKHVVSRLAHLSASISVLRKRAKQSNLREITVSPSAISVSRRIRDKRKIVNPPQVGSLNRLRNFQFPSCSLPIAALINFS